MKKILLLLSMLWSIAYGQTTGYFRYDSTRLEKVGGNNELIILNATRGVTGGVLTNVGNGRTAFVTPGGGGSGGLSGGNLGSGFRIYYPPSEGTKTLFNGYSVLIDSSSNSNGLTFKIDSFNIATRAFRDKLKDSLGAIKQATLVSGTNIKTVNGSSLLGSGDLTVGGSTNTSIGSAFRVAVNGTNNIKSLRAGTNVVLDSLTTGEVRINASGDTTEANILDYGAIPNDGLSDTAAIKAAQATGKNMFIPPVGEFLWDGFRCVLNKGQRVRGGGLNSIIKFTKDTCDVFHMANDSSRIEGISFRGKGRGTFPGAETFTYSNAIYISGSANTVENCYFKNVKGACVTSWAGATIYDNAVYKCSGDSNTIGVYLVLNSEYGRYQNNSFQHSRTAFVERCSGNNKWDMINGDYADRGFYLNSPGGCNGDHGSVSNSTFNHCTTAVEIGQTATEYLFLNVKMYYGNLLIGTSDTARQVIFRDCVFSTNTITTTKAKNCLIAGGAFQPNNSPDVTVSGTTGIEFCNIMNSPYQSTTCGGGASLTNPMTTQYDIIVGGTSGTPTRKAKGADGTFWGIQSGVADYYSLSGGGDVTKVGTPVNNQIGVWTGNGTIEGDANLTWSGSALALTGTSTISTSLTTPLLIGGTGTTSDLVLQSTSGVGASGAEIIFKGGNNGASTFATISNSGEWGIGTGPASGIRLFMLGTGTTNSTLPVLIRNAGSVNLFQMADGGDWRIGNQSGTPGVGVVYNKTAFGTATAFTPTAWVDIAASETGGSALRIRNGTAPTSPNEGDIWQASNHLMYRSNDGNTYQLDQQGGSGTVTSFTATDGNGFDFSVANSTTTPTLTATTTVGNQQVMVSNSGAISGSTALTFGSGFLNIGALSGNTGKITLTGATSGAINIVPQDASGTFNFNLPISAGSSGYLLTSAGGGSTAMTWTDPSTLGGATVGTYTPTITNGSNVSSSSNISVRYIKNGSQVVVIGTISVTATSSAANTVVSISLPAGATSNFGASTDASGAVVEAGGLGGVCTADATNDILVLTYTSGSTSARSISFSVSYTII